MSDRDNLTRDNRDHAEIAKFNALAANWWDSKGPMWPLHAINPLRINLINDHLDVQGKKVLDIGCGGGLASEALARRGAKVTGIDLAEISVEIARQHAADSGVKIDYRCMDAETLADEQPASFDLVCCMETLEHVPYPDRLVATCARLAKPGALVVFSTINRNLKAFVFAILGAEYILGLLPKGTHQYSKCITPAELASYAESSGLEPAHSSGLVYNPLTRSFKLNRDLSVNYFIITRRT